MKKKASAKIKLKKFIDSYIPVDELMKAGFFIKGTRRNQYEKIAERVCWYFGFKSIYEYKKVCRGKICDGNNCDGQNINCKNYRDEIQPILWPKLEISQEDLVSKDSWLN